ncbi:bifunctional diaminohydroxyphosphoribosylaminopyrimidine deaminase/5-amino-6-(5-phosphoribosylamino)uracil reductase RibD [Caldimonas thermodepolymerans]|uniref:Riboflavin biosynthesis protein RibD n=1 Tax=Caldimonas thermodepolymerans TaxID=215580 RepID=A0A2S5T9H8_9BURK|nr:bifunctional diaminohydroxyphosphoribosylaminopyrimidine deaminase/5-amino-6-(5-phosphoribosylamino)uracil reductase RibD [Caldimonas thermodepolymerans]PPE71606.1 bifunctional diaminohydroxyphosphoribosylaminopyrimidine deaminase/5-amino-6-(5-phosphoribosylamino)uracil reductase RibD [Caldimonas thermodepolymerans]QPC30630.1 bifunctional diaminohydroxyphosphoribosylaminopyrimidine deaminase/5-amino-6-(5-phosphoribosylamino)uracil reductase RibD [Caldimonas thermodepolymerans]RDI02764.1 diami
MSRSDDDRHWMAQALEQARQARIICPPNPAVGCVLVLPDGSSVAAHTQATGSAHAEVAALQALAASGRSAHGATAYVTLEPCSHFGRTPPCADALVRAGVRRVVVAVRDPNPLVAGRGIERLRAAGIQVDEGLMADEAREVNLGFFSRMLRQRPWVRMKVAASLDGRTALDNGVSQWITSPAARADGHAWRARAGAVLTGIGTVLEDDPRLDVREVQTPRQPLRVIVDSRLQTPPTARILPPPGQVLVYAARPDEAAAQALRAAGAEVQYLPNPHGKVDLPAMLADLAARGINELHVEAGHKLNGSFVREGLVDEFLVYLAPRLIGPGRGMLELAPLAALDRSVALEFVDVQRVGPDLRVIARPPGRDRF